jgi:hypothetical protein
MTIRDLIQNAKREEFITVTELALLTRRNPQVLYRICRRGEMPGMNRIGRTIRIHRATAIGHFRRLSINLDSILD